jgi:hypothetical protein
VAAAIQTGEPVFAPTSGVGVHDEGCIT